MSSNIDISVNAAENAVLAKFVKRPTASSGISTDMTKLRLFMPNPLQSVRDVALKLKAGVNPNEFPFVALVTYGGVLSDQFVGGTEVLEGGPYKVLIPANILREKIQELAGKGVFAQSELNSHSNTQKIGDFIHSWVETQEAGSEVVYAGKASGILHRDSAPELIDDIVVKARAGELGFSYDLKSVQFQIQAVSSETDPILQVTDFEWRGATILYRDAAAYKFTQLAATKLERKGELLMNKEDKAEIQELFTSGLKAGLEQFQTELVAETITPLNKKLDESISSISERVNALSAAHDEIKAGLTSKPPADPPKDEAPQSQKDPSELAAQIAKDVGQSVVESNKPVLEAMQSLTESIKGLTAQGDSKPGQNKGFRLSAQSAQWVSKYAPEADKTDPLAQLSQAIDTIKASKTLKNDEKLNMVERLVKEKNATGREIAAALHTAKQLELAQSLQTEPLGG